MLSWTFVKVNRVIFNTFLQLPIKICYILHCIDLAFCYIPHSWAVFSNKRSVSAACPTPRCKPGPRAPSLMCFRTANFNIVCQPKMGLVKDLSDCLVKKHLLSVIPDDLMLRDIR